MQSTTEYLVLVVPYGFTDGLLEVIAVYSKRAEAVKYARMCVRKGRATKAYVLRRSDKDRIM